MLRKYIQESAKRNGQTRLKFDEKLFDLSYLKVGQFADLLNSLMALALNCKQQNIIQNYIQMGIEAALCPE